MPCGVSVISCTETNHFQSGRCELWKSVPAVTLNW